ncbi:hypothetical protein F4810DRAFT_441794 [Camillea tinctor]|nr:hypothetical protein F4810DRAFT_441794 [Camillea tinctor]
MADSQSTGMPMLPPPVNPSDRGRGPLIMGLTWTFSSLCVIIVAVRFWVRIAVTKLVSVEDWLMLTAVILNLACQSCLTVAYHWGFGKHDGDLTFNQLVKISKWCQTILDIAKEAGVKEVVASTTLGVSQLDVNVRVYPGSFMEKHMINKKSLETAVEDRGFEHFTFLRPTFYMANFLEPKVSRYAEVRDKRSWTTSMTPDTQLPIIDHVDIAKFAVAAFQDPGAFHGRAIGLASEQMGIQDMLDLLAEAAGQPGSIRAIFMTDEEIEAQANMSGFSNSHKVLRTASDYVNMDELRSITPLTSFKEFLEREKEAVKRTYH